MGGEEEVNNGVRGSVYGGGRGGSDIVWSNREMIKLSSVGVRLYVSNSYLCRIIYCVQYSSGYSLPWPE